MFNVGIAVISDSSFRKERVSTTQDIIKKYISEIGSVSKIEIIPDNKDMIMALFIKWSDTDHLDLIVSTGGTGLSPTDLTPEATKEIIDKEIPGIPEYIRMKTSFVTPRACLSRSICGIRKQCLIINLPGSEKAVKEWLEYLVPLLPHALETIQGKTFRCGG
jgi:molybdopterin adenylyltransferase